MAGFGIVAPLLGAAPAISVGGTVVSCGFSRWDLDLTKGEFDLTTFCTSANWTEFVPTRKRAAARFSGFMSKGVSWTNPGLWFNASTVTALLLTADAGITVAGNAHDQSEALGIQAAGGSNRDVGFLFTGALTFTWVEA